MMYPVSSGSKPRLLFCSYHGYFDPSSGAALATRDLLELLTGRGWPSGVFCGPQLDFERSPSLPKFLSDHHLQVETKHGTAGSLPFTLYHLVQGGIPVTIFAPTTAASGQVPTRQEGQAFLDLFDEVRRRFQPDILLTYGGHWLAQQLIDRAKRVGLPVVFGLHNFAYTKAGFLRTVNAVLVPSEFAREHYRQSLGLSCTAIPYVCDGSRLRCASFDRRYVTFVNPQPHKGVFLFARIAYELGRRRPDIPLLVVEGRGGVDWLARTGLDLSGLRNLNRMANTPDPRHFYQFSRLVLMPSLWWESFGRVAAEALVNGIPVLASNRGALPETLAGAGFLFDVPARYTPDTRLVPTADEVAPWLETILRFWDDAALYEAESRRAEAAAEAWRPDHLAPRFEELFTRVFRPS